MTLTNEDLKSLNKKYKDNLSQLRIDIKTLTKTKRKSHDENVELQKLLLYRMQYTPYGGLAYNTPEYLEMLKKMLK